ncbi:alpha-glucosidase family protein [Leeia oryzae]|uniref:alpha-glucosidase family protein n=1 Tax=Leeia oryzae TaxID=356662 RepID=UPI0003784D1B|nr:alpha-glucosidase family protein [Leeia oryzae]
MDKQQNEWWRGALIYQVYPRSFQDTNGDGIGDLPGITGRLEHIARLGAEAVWISPFFKSPMADFGYDVSDYRSVDPMFGDLADFDALVARAHALGLKVLIDLVLSHTSDQHAWFQESRASRDNPRSDWYVWADAQADGSPPNNWLSVFGGSSWQWDTRRLQYYLHNFLASQPDLNFHNKDVQDALLDVARFWLDRGVDGFRLDAINFGTHDPELRNNPPLPREMESPGAPRSNPYTYQRHLYDKTQPQNLVFLARLRELINQYPGAMTVGEIGDDLQYPTLAAYTRGDQHLHMAYVFTLLTEECSAPYLHRVMTDFLAEAGDAYACWSLGNHDVPRVVSRWEQLGGSTEERARLLLAFLLALPGAVCLYQGEELALPEADVPFELLQDPYGKVMWPEYKGRDGCRTPMAWDASTNGGFSEGDPWLPVAAEHIERAVANQEMQAGSTLAFYRHLIEWRRAYPALRFGGLRLLPAHEQVFAFEREYQGERILCAFNFSDRPARYELPYDLNLETLSQTSFQSHAGHSVVGLPPLQACFARIKEGV